MSAPFGKAPTFQEYLDWLKDNNHYFHSTGFADIGLAGAVKLISINDANGKSVYIFTRPLDERLLPTVVFRLDNILGVDSPFPKTPGAPKKIDEDD